MRKSLKKNEIFYALFIVLSSVLVIILAKHFFRNSLLKSEEINISFNEQKIVDDKSILGGTGLEFGHAGRIWLNTLSGYSNVYSGLGEVVQTKTVDGSSTSLFVKVPGTPTGMIFSDENSFSGDAFVFVTKEGKIFGWHKDKKTSIEPLVATLRVDNSTTSAIYTGATSIKNKNGWELLVADNANNKIEVYDESFKRVDMGNKFVNKAIDQRFSVFNLKEINQNIYVTYKTKDYVGAISIFDADGNFVKNLVVGDELQAPYGLAIAPTNFGKVSNALLVGDIVSGNILAIDPINGKFITKFKNEKGGYLKVEGLQTLTFGTNNGAGKTNELFVSTKTGFSKLQMILDENSQQNKKIENTDLTDEEKVEQEFLEQNDFRVKYTDLNNELKKICILRSSDCLQGVLLQKQEELETIYNKIFSDTKIIEAEWQKQNFDESVKKAKTEKLEAVLLQLKKQDPESFQDFIKNECAVYTNNFYSGTSADNMQTICQIYKTENWLKELYVLRSIYIRIELGPLGEVQKNNLKIQTKEFKDVIDAEESRIGKSY